ncbi:DUF3488 and transglutaminase-like domain-containing protein [Vandammella animalimorsus]|uniref:transglutaminase family protein n=1 Tax=Vandammella animalimorsus TaxID=2029117 RepID=UPI0031BB815F
MKHRLSRWLDAQPRQTRDTLFLLAVLSLLALQMARALPTWAGVFALGLLGWRFALALRQRPLPKRWQLALLLALALLGAGWEVLTQQSISGAALTLLLMLLALKTLEMHTRRDALVLFFLGFFCIVTTFLFNQTLPVALLMVLVFWGLLTALVNAHKPVGRPPLREAARSAALLVLIGLPLIGTLYVLFPRFAPLWGIPNAPGQGRTGLSESMQVGTISQLAQSREIALRLRFAPGSPIPSQGQMYFRGPVLSHLQGRHWTARGDLPVQPQAEPGTAYNPFEPAGQAVRYETVLEPHGQRWLLPLEWLPQVQPQAGGLRSALSHELVWNSHRPLNSATRYQASSHLGGQFARLAKPTQLRQYLQLPQDGNARTRAWAAQLREQHPRHAGPAQTLAADQALIAQVLQQLRQEEFHYTLQPPLYGEDTADEFWFVHRRGFCEHIASAFAILMRAADIPARIVTGYQGGEPNPIDGVWTVRQSDAHAWVEVWLPEQGWTRIDPTGAIAPERIELSQSQALDSAGADERARGFGAGARWLLRLQALGDAIDYRWTQWVLNYDQGRQQSLLQTLGLQRLNWSQLALLIVALVLIIGLGYLGLPQLLRRRQDPWQRLLAQTRQRLAQAGLQLPEHLPPRRMAQEMQAFFGVQATADAAQWLLLMDAQRYAAQPPASLAELERRWRQLRWPAPPPP